MCFTVARRRSRRQGVPALAGRRTASVRFRSLAHADGVTKDSSSPPLLATRQRASERKGMGRRATFLGRMTNGERRRRSPVAGILLFRVHRETKWQTHSFPRQRAKRLTVLPRYHFHRKIIVLEAVDAVDALHRCEDKVFSQRRTRSGDCLRMAKKLPNKIEKQIDKAGLPRGGSVPFVPQLDRNHKGKEIMRKGT
jgi:hypothetical protein